MRVEGVPPPIRVRDVTFDWSRAYVLGVVNVTPDSFSDGGRFLAPDRAVAHALELAAAGADLLDVGGESTRPEAAPVDEAEELERVVPVIRALRARTAAPISIDTMKAAVGDAALAAGADLINDVSGLRADPDLARVAARRGAPVILGHLRGAPRTMQREIAFSDVVAEVAGELAAAAAAAAAAGVPRDRVIFDPGLGFGKTAAQTLALLRGLPALRRALAGPLCVGPSRKSFLGAVTGRPAGERLMGTAAATAAAIVLGADLVRLHDVGELRDVVRVADAIRRA